jgi:hypothetical protein
MNIHRAENDAERNYDVPSAYSTMEGEAFMNHRTIIHVHTSEIISWGVSLNESQTGGELVIEFQSQTSFRLIFSFFSHLKH